jgi:hypothetical protein
MMLTIAAMMKTIVVIVLMIVTKLKTISNMINFFFLNL